MRLRSIPVVGIGIDGPFIGRTCGRHHRSTARSFTDAMVLKKRASLLLIAGLALAASILLTGCAPSEAADPRGTESPTTEAQDIVPQPGRTIPATPTKTVESLAGYRIAVVTGDSTAAS